MALTFAINSLVSIGLSPSDVATIYGAARKVGTWVTAPGNDRQFLEFLQVDKSDVIKRKGLIDTERLNARWGRKLHYFTNGRKQQHQSASQKPIIPNNDDFTWLMTIFVVCLDAAASLSTVTEVIKGFLVAVFGELFHPDYSDFFERELPSHIQGWRSNGNVRGMPLKAKAEWAMMEQQKKHPPGFIPNNDAGEVVRMFEWLAAGHSQEFLTSSSDVYCLACLLSGIGLDFLVPVYSNDSLNAMTVDANRLVLRFSTEFHIHQSQHPRVRYGMRVPLDCMEEVVSLWPGEGSDNNRKRDIFKNGMKAASGVHWQVCLGHNQTRQGYSFALSVEPSDGGASEIADRLAQRYLLAITTTAVTALDYLAKSTWKLQEGVDVGLASQLESPDPEIPRELLSDFQCFLLGYYYSIMMPLLDTTQLSTPEVFGQWTWCDSMFFKEVEVFVRERAFTSPGHIGFMWKKSSILSMLAYLFAGSENLQRSRVGSTSTGVLGKLALLDSSLLGLVQSRDMVGKMYLLDIDGSCIPSDFAGVVNGGMQPDIPSQLTHLPSSIPYHELLQQIHHGPNTEDFTSHIEPDWDHDPQNCLIAYRYRGRLVQRFSPWIITKSILTWAVPAWRTTFRERNFAQEVPSTSSSVCALLKLEQSFGGHQVVNSALLSERQTVPLLIPTKHLPKARSCMAALYHISVYNDEYSWEIQDIMADAIRASLFHQFPRWTMESQDALVVPIRLGGNDTAPIGWVIIL